MDNKGIRDLLKQSDNKYSEEDKKKLERIDNLINESKNVEITKSNLHIIIISLLVIVIILLLLVSILDKKVNKTPKNNIEIKDIRNCW